SFFFQAEDGIRDFHVTGVQTCALPIFRHLRTTYKRCVYSHPPPWSTKKPRSAGAERGFGKTGAEPYLSLDFRSLPTANFTLLERSEERRVGKEGRPRGARYTQEIQSNQ